MPFVDRNGVRIHWRSDGHPEAPPLVLSNSLGTDLAFWDPVMPRLADHFRVIRMDTRGHGASDAPAGVYTLAQLAADALAVADAARADRFAFAGVSLGGAIGMHLAIHHGERLTRLMLSNTAASFPRAVFDERIAKVQAGGMASICDAVLQRFFTDEFRARDGAVLASVRSTLLALDPAGYIGCCAAVRDADVTDGLASIRTPTLVLIGDHDQSTPPDRGRAIAAAIPGARLAALSTAHLSHPEQPGAFVDLAVPFLRGETLPNCNGPLTAPSPRAAETFEQALARGLNRRSDTLGADYVNSRIGDSNPITADYQQMITRYAWDEVWNRPALEGRVRRLLVLAIAASLARWEEFDLHLRAGLRGGLELSDIKEVLIQTAIYAGVPAANTAFAHLKQALAEAAPAAR
ncbi:MAG: 3-oxoadipate enol-lactonase [Lautropia sp.]